MHRKFISELGVIALSIVLLTGISFIPVLQAWGVCSHSHNKRAATAE